MNFTKTTAGALTAFYLTGVSLAPGNHSIDVTGNWGPKGGSFGGQLDFTVAAVPEPATWSLMIGGFGLLGAAMRRRRVSVSYANA